LISIALAYSSAFTSFLTLPQRAGSRQTHVSSVFGDIIECILHWLRCGSFLHLDIPSFCWWIRLSGNGRRGRRGVSGLVVATAGRGLWGILRRI
jgi:hypothetical protein